MTDKVDFGRMTEDETLTLAVEALHELRLDMRIKAVLEGFNKRERETLRQDLEEDDDE